ncbi:MAG: carboxypeptidase regulatory-like domain-containing protein [Gemmatimonadetes bacterium]|nr:carboxypeptidase regulatory-like domain-containing protein [Gemmatimonadota bacterium]
MTHRLVQGALALALMGGLLVPASSAAQTVLVRIVNAETAGPIVGALAYLDDTQGSTFKNTLTDERGRALFVGIPEGSYRVRVEMIGMGTTETDVFDISAGATITQEVRMESSAIQLEGIEVELEADRCTVRPGAEGAMVAEIWDEARKALSAASLTDERDRYRYETIKYDRKIDRQTGVVLDEERSRREGYMDTPFESYPAEDLVQNGFVQRDGQGYLYMAPDADVLLSDAFLDTHCFRVAGRRDDGLVGLGFEPTGDNKTVPDILGTMWIDAETAELRWLEFTYEFLEQEMMSDQVGGRVDFQRMPDGSWIVPEWWIRMPIMGAQTDFQGRQRPYIAEYHQTGGLVAEVREAGGRSLGQRAETGGVEGIVMDSLGVPLGAVRVGVIGQSQEVYTNAQGEFSITGLTAGRYQVRFVDPQLEDAGFIPPPVEQDVIRGELAQIEYHMPSKGDVLFEACRGEERANGTAVLAGTVIDALGQPVPDATVRVSWTGYDVLGGGRVTNESVRNVTEQTNGFEMTTGSAGTYSFCGVPAGASIRLSAESANRESDDFEVVIPDYEVGAMRVLELTNRR